MLVSNILSTEVLSDKVLLKVWGILNISGIFLIFPEILFKVLRIYFNFYVFGEYLNLPPLTLNSLTLLVPAQEKSKTICFYVRS